MDDKKTAPAQIKQKSYLAVEIGDDYLKVAHLKVSPQKTDIVDLLVAKISGLAPEEVSRKIADFAKERRIKRIDTINIIPSHFAISKNIEIPSVDKKEIKEIMDLQAGRHTPYSRNEIIMDYSEVGVFHGRYTKILLVIVKKDVITARYDIIKKAGFRADLAFLGADAVGEFLAGLVAQAPAERPVAVVYLDGSHADFTIVFNGQLIYLRPMPSGLVPAAGKTEEETRHAFVLELRRSLEAYQAENIEAVPSKIYFAGATDLAAGMEREIESNVGLAGEMVGYNRVPGTLHNDFVRLTQEFKSVSPLSVIAAPIVAQAVKLNLIPEDVKFKKDLKDKAREITKMGIFSLAIFVIFCAILLTNMFFKDLYYQKILSSYTRENEEAKSLKDISDRASIVKRFLREKGQSLFVITELFKAMPKEVYISSVNVRGDSTLSFTGTADSMSRVFSLVTDLENNRAFKNVKVDFTKSRRVQDQELADFGITMSIKEYIMNPPNVTAMTSSQAGNDAKDN